MALVEDDLYIAAPVANESSARSALLRIQAVDVTDPAQVATVERSFTGTITADPFIVPARAESFQYDADGNLTQDGRWNYTWDGENRLLRAEMRSDVVAQTVTATHAIENVYDSQGRRVQVVESILPPSSGWMPVSDKIFLYDGWNLLVESDSVNSTQRSYVWGIDASGTMQGAGGVGGLLWTTAGSQTHAAGYDANGNIIAWVNASDGTLSGTREYGAFGENIAATGVGVLDEWSGIPFGFSTKYQDRLTSHYYYGYRFYDTSTGRWLSRDPIEEQGGLNLYAFVGNNGVNRWDLLGMKWGRTNCHAVSTGIGFSAYTGLGGSARVSVSGEICDCCNLTTGEFIEADSWHVTVRAQGKVGIGIGGDIRVGGYYLSLGKLLGPQLELIDVSGGYEKKCNQTGHAFFRSQKALDLSVSFGVGGGVGVTGRVGVKGFVGMEVEFKGNDWESYVFWGYSASGSVDMHLLLATYTKSVYWGGDKERVLVSSGSFK